MITKARHLIWATILITALGPPSEGLAQVQLPEPGTRVRAHLVGGRARPVGVVEAWRADTLFLRIGQRHTELALPLGSLTSLEVSEGRRRGPGFPLGFLVGAASFGLMALGTTDNISAAGGDATSAVVILAVIGGALGGVIGALIPVERWRQLPLETNNP